MRIFNTLLDLFYNILDLGQDLFYLVLPWIMLLIFVVWCLFAVNWQRVWPFLGQGACVPLILLTVLAALVWSAIAPKPCDCLGDNYYVPNFWWQLIVTSAITCLALFCGWLQGLWNLTPAEVSFDPPEPQGHGHEAHH